MKTTLKTMVCFLLCLVSLVLICSCEMEENPFHIADVTNNLSNTEIEYDGFLRSYDPTADQHKSFVFENETYQCSYKETYKNLNMGKSLMRYETEKGQLVLFDATSGAFAGINFITPEYYKTQPSAPNLSSEELELVKQKAIGILSNYVDISQYEVEESSHTYQSHKPTPTPLVTYKIQYYKKIDGIMTTEKAAVSYDSKGNIIEYCMIDTGIFDHTEFRITEEEKARISKDLESKLKSIAKKLEIGPFTYEIKETILSVDRNGTPIIIVYVNIMYGKDLSAGIVLAGAVDSSQ